MTALIRDGRELARRLPCAVTDTIARLEDYGHQAVVVGGAVRSLIQGQRPADWDLASTATPDEVMRLFRRVHPTGVKYGTVTVVEGGEQLEVTTFRADGEYRDGRRPEAVAFGRDLTADLARRDFTVNAIALDRRGAITDPWGGIADLEARVIRAVGDPRQRFAEDALRLLRAVRLAAELRFGLEAETAAALKEQAALIARVAPERRLQELRRLLLARGAAWGLAQLGETGLWEHVWPGNPLPAAAPGAMAALPFDWELRLAACAVAGREHVPPAAVSGLSLLRLPRRTAARVLAIMRAWPPPWPASAPPAATGGGPKPGDALVAAIVRLGRNLTQDLVWLASAAGPADTKQAVPDVQQLLAAERPLSVAELAISGRDVIAAGCPPGPLVGQWLQRQLLLAAAGKVPNDPRELLHRARQDFSRQ